MHYIRLIFACAAIETIAAQTLVEPQLPPHDTRSLRFEAKQGNRLFAVSGAGAISVWNIQDPSSYYRECTIFTDANSVVPDSRSNLLYVLGQDGFVRAWTSRCQPAEMASLKVSEFPLTVGTQIKDSPEIVVGSANGEIFRVDVATGKAQAYRIPPAPTAQFPKFLFGSILHQLRSITADNSSQVDTDLLTQMLTEVTALAWLNSNRLLVGQLNGSIHSCDLSANRDCSLVGQHPWPGEKSALLGTGVHIAVPPDRRSFATAGRDGIIRLWNENGTASGDLQRPEGTCAQITQPITSLVYTPNGRTLISAANDGCVLFWNIRSRQIQKLGLTDVPEGHEIAVHGSGNFMAVASNSGQEVSIWNLDYSPQSHSSGSQKMHAPRVVFDTTGKNFALADGREIAIYSSAGDHVCNSPPSTLGGDFGGQVAFLDTGIVHIDREQQLNYYGLDCRLLQQLPLAYPPNSGVILATNRSTAFISIGSDLITWVPGWKSTKLLRKRMGTGTLTTAMSADEERILIGNSRGQLFAYSLDGIELSSFETQRESIFYVTAARNGIFATASRNGYFRLWKSDGTPIGRTARVPSLPYFTGVSISPDGDILMFASAAGGVVLWNTSEGAVRRTIGGGPVYAAAFSPTLSQFVTVSFDGSFRIWAPPGPRRGRSLGFSAETISPITATTVNEQSARISVVDRAGNLQGWEDMLRRKTEVARLGFVPTALQTKGNNAVFVEQQDIFVVGDRGTLVASAGGQVQQQVFDDANSRLWFVVNVIKPVDLDSAKVPQARSPRDQFNEWILRTAEAPSDPAKTLRELTPKDVVGIPKGVTAIALSADGTLFAGTSFGYLFSCTSSGSSVLARVSAAPITTIATDEGRLVIGDGEGRLSVWSLTDNQVVSSVATRRSLIWQELPRLVRSVTVKGQNMVVVESHYAGRRAIEAWSLGNPMARLWEYSPGVYVSGISSVGPGVFLSSSKEIFVLDAQGRRAGRFAFLGADRAVAIAADGRFLATHPNITEMVAVTSEQGRLTQTDSMARADFQVEFFESPPKRYWRVLWQRGIWPAWYLFRRQATPVQLFIAGSFAWVLLIGLWPSLLARLHMERTDGSPSILGFLSRVKLLDTPLDWACSNRRCRDAYLSEARQSILSRSRPAIPGVYVDLGQDLELKRISSSIRANTNCRVWFHAPGGRGKTTLAKRLAQIIAESDSVVVPLVIEHDWLLDRAAEDDVMALLDDVARYLSSGGHMPTIHMVRQWLSEGKVVLILDGASEKSVRSRATFFRTALQKYEIRHFFVTSRDEPPSDIGFVPMIPMILTEERLDEFCAAYVGSEAEESFKLGREALAKMMRRSTLTPLLARLVLVTIAEGPPNESYLPFEVIRRYILDLHRGSKLRSEDFYWAAQVSAASIIEWSTFTPTTVRRDHVVGALSLCVNATYFRTTGYLSVEPTAVVDELVKAGLFSANASGQIKFREEPVAEYLAVAWLRIQDPALISQRRDALNQLDKTLGTHFENIFEEVVRCEAKFNATI
jgi:WD40 repeat protein